MKLDDGGRSAIRDNVLFSADAEMQKQTHRETTSSGVPERFAKDLGCQDAECPECRNEPTIAASMKRQIPTRSSPFLPNEAKSSRGMKEFISGGL